MMPSIDFALAGKKILLLPRYTRNGPSSRLRMEQFIPSLTAAGASVEVSPFFDDAYLQLYFKRGVKAKRHILSAFMRRLRKLRHLRSFDAVWVEKELFPFLPGMFEALLGKVGIPYGIDFDDAIFHNYDRSNSRGIRLLLTNKLRPLLRGAAFVTAGNEYLASYARRGGAANVLNIPTVVDVCRYSTEPESGHDGAFNNGKRELRIGWIGTPANARYLRPVVAAINRLHTQLPVRLVTIGAPPLEDLLAPEERHVWREDTEALLLSQIDVGVMPLVDSDWERGKCGYKLIQYLAASKPVVASPVGVNVDIVTSEVGFLADSVDEWVAAFRALAADPAMRTHMGRAGRSRVERHYSVDAVAPRIIDAFATATKTPVP